MQFDCQRGRQLNAQRQAELSSTSPHALQHEMTTHHRPYKCTIQIALPSNQYAQHLKDIISVDQEISDKVVKSFAVVESTSCTQHDTTIDDGGKADEEMNKNDMRVLQM